MPIVIACVGTWPSGKSVGVRVARRLGQLDDAGVRVERRAGLVEADVAVAAEAEEGQAEAAGFADLVLVAEALGVEVGRDAVREDARCAGSRSTWSKRCRFM